MALLKTEMISTLQLHLFYFGSGMIIFGNNTLQYTGKARCEYVSEGKDLKAIYLTKLLVLTHMLKCSIRLPKFNRF